MLLSEGWRIFELGPEKGCETNQNRKIFDGILPKGFYFHVFDNMAESGC